MSKHPTNFISEWYGVRLHPALTSTGHSDTIELIKRKQCPFLTSALDKATVCTKNANSKGVCTITTTRGSSRDWIVCPYRVLEKHIICEVTRRIFADGRGQLPVYPVVHLEEEVRRRTIFEQASKGSIYLYFQEKLGGEIGLSKSKTTPELSFDITIVECSAEGDWLIVKRYGLLEVQTMDFHGSYRHAVRALENAIDLHKEGFAEQLKNNPEWSGRSIEGPNIANVFKRTLYQLLLKFELAGKDRCAGVVLGLPESVWESWGPHFGGLDWVDEGGHWTAEGARARNNSWVFVLRPEEESDSPFWNIAIVAQMNLDGSILVERAFDVVPDLLAKNALPALSESIVQRAKRLYAKTRLG